MASTADAMQIDDDEPTTTTNARAPVARLIGHDNTNAVAAAQPANASATLRKLYDSPELADRYVPLYSTIEDVVYRDSAKFALKPPCWEKWKPKEYHQFAQYLECVDLTPLARQLDKPLEEVYHMYHAVVVNPLYDARKASSKGVQGMKGWFRLYNEYGTPCRVWADDEDKNGELDNIADGTVHLILQESGNKCHVKLDDLSESDLEWIQENVYLQNRQILSGRAAGKQTKYNTEDGLPPYKKALKRKPLPEPITPSKQPRLAGNGNATAPAKMLATPSNFASSPQLSGIDLNPLDTPASRHLKLRQHSTAKEGPSLSTPPNAVALSSPQFSVTSPERFADRTWAATGVTARFYDTSPGSIILMELNTLRKITVPKEALTSDDKEWLNTRRKDKLINAAQWKSLMFENAKRHAARPWTDRKIMASYVFVSHLRIHLELAPGSAGFETISMDDLTQEDSGWLEQNVSQAERRTLKGSATTKATTEPAKKENTRLSAGEATSRPSRGADEDCVIIDSIPDKSSDHEAGSSITEETRQTADNAAASKPLGLVKSGKSVAASDPARGCQEKEMEDAHINIPRKEGALVRTTSSKAPEEVISDDTAASAPEPRSEDDSGNAIDEPYESISGAPIRQWTEFNLEAKLVGIAYRKVFLRVEGREGIERLPMERWSHDDKVWVKEYLVVDQRKILSGKIEVGEAA